MVIEVTREQGLTLADCPCHRQAVILASHEVPLPAELIRDNLLRLIEHAQRCPDASSIQSANTARVNRLMAERYPRIP